jgi:hypothetical protein
MTKASEEKCYKRVYTGIMEKMKTTICCLSLDYKMAISNHTLGDYITIKTIIENPSDISYNKYPKKSKNFDKANNKPTVVLFQRFIF